MNNEISEDHLYFPYESELGDCDHTIGLYRVDDWTEEGININVTLDQLSKLKAGGTAYVLEDKYNFCPDCGVRLVNEFEAVN